MASNIPLPTAVALLAIGLLLHIIGLATPVWYFYERDPVDIKESGVTAKKTQRDYGGLWEWCRKIVKDFDAENVDDVTETNCDDPETFHETTLMEKFNHDDAFGAVRAMTILGAIAGFVALIAAILLLLGKRDNMKHLPLVALCASVAACVFIFIGVIVWGVEIHPVHFGYSLVFVLLGHNFMAAGGFLAYIAGNGWVGHLIPQRSDWVIAQGVF